MKSLAFVVLAVLLASGSTALAATPVDLNNIPPDTPERFMDRYGIFVRKDEGKALKAADKQVRTFDKKLRKAKTEAERRGLDALKAPALAHLETLIAAFWAVRDPDPSTPENEEKKRIDERIADIESERFFTSAEAPGLMFSSYGGYTGDLAEVYLLHGEPDGLTKVEGRLFVPLMLWVYGDPEQGSILYAFLFIGGGYGHGARLHTPEVYQMDPCGAINAIAVNRSLNTVNLNGDGCPLDIQMVYQELITSMPSGSGNGYIFAWALTNFSHDPTVHLGNAMSAPLPAAKAARTAGSALYGETPAVVPEQGSQTVMADCSHCTTMIPATTEGSGSNTELRVVHKDVDWTIAGDSALAQMSLMLAIEGPGKPVFINKMVKISGPSDILVKGSLRTAIPLFTPGELDQLPVGTYRVSVYLKGSLRNRYNAWVISFTK